MVDVLIVGAGPTGLFLANLLAEQKISFRIIDENPSRVQESRAIAIQARSMELFQKIGVVEKFLEKGLPGVGVSYLAQGKVAAKINFNDIGRDDTPYPYIFFLSQSVTEQILEENLFNKYSIHVERGVKFSASQTQTSTYVVGCDGARSSVRKSLGLSFEGGTYASEFRLADAKVNWDLPPDQLMIVVGEKNLGLIMPLKGSDLSRVITISQPTDSESASATEAAAHNLETRSATTIEEVQSVLQEISFHPVTLSNPQWITKYRVHHRSVEQMSVGSVFLAGDSAHIHSPVGGQGMNTGLQDAANLAWKLAAVIKKHAPPSLLETYNSERLPIAKKLLNFTDRIFSRVSSSSYLAQQVRNFVVPLAGKTVLKTNFVRRLAFGFVSQLNIHYHPSLAVKENLKKSRDGKIHAGDRVPDVRINTQQTMLELTTGYKFHLLVMTENPLSAEEKEKIAVSWKEKNILGSGQAPIHWFDGKMHPEVLKQYAVESILVSLVRPDGYIGYQADQL